MRFKSFFVPALALLAAVSLPSCDKGKELFQSAADKVKELRGKGSGGGDYEGASVSTVKVVNESEGKAVIMNERRLVVVEFYSDTWGPCKTIAPVLERLADKNSEKIRIIKVDVTKDGKWAQEENVRGTPAFRLYSGGMLVDQFAGGYPEKQLQAKIDKYATVVKASAASGQKLGKDGKPTGAAPEPTIRPMPKNWMPSGVKSE